jgi:YihY family inner membrane protein
VLDRFVRYDTIDRVRPVASGVYTVFKNEEVSFLAAAIAYYGFVSVIPLLLLTLSVATAIGGQELADAVLGLVDELLTADALAAVNDVLSSSSGRNGATVVSLTTLTWSGLRVFRGLDRAFSRVYGTENVGSFVSGLRDAAVTLVGGGVGVGGAVVAGSVVSGVSGSLAALLGPLVLPATLVVAFLPMYLVLPDTPITLGEALPGAVTAALGWTALATVFGIYASLAGSFALYGVLGAALMLVTWLYFAALAVLVGAVLNAVLGGVTETPSPDE